MSPSSVAAPPTTPARRVRTGKRKKVSFRVRLSIAQQCFTRFVRRVRRCVCESIRACFSWCGRIYPLSKRSSRSSHRAHTNTNDKEKKDDQPKCADAECTEGQCSELDGKGLNDDVECGTCAPRCVQAQAAQPASSHVDLQSVPRSGGVEQPATPLKLMSRPPPQDKKNTPSAHVEGWVVL